MATDREIQVVLRAKDELSAALKKAGLSVGDFGKTADKARGPFDGLFGAIKQGIGIAGGLSIFNSVKSAISGAAGSAIDFEKSMSGIKAVSGATQADMTRLSGLALQLGKDTSFSAGEAARGIEELLKGGVSIADVFGGAATASLSLAAAGSVSLGEAAEIAANALNMFGLQGSDMANVADKIAGAAAASTIGVNDFRLSLAAVGSVANLAGISFDSTATAITAMGAAGIKGSDAGTSLKAMLNTLIPTTDIAKTKMRELGIITADGTNQFIDASGKMKTFQEIAGVLEVALGGLTESQRLLATELIFGADGMRAAGVLAKEGAGGMKELDAAMVAAGGSAKMAQERLNNVAGDLEQLKGSAETAGIILLSTLAPAFREVLQASTRWVNTFTQEAQTIIQTARNIAGEHGIGLIPAAFIAIEGRIKEVFGEKWSSAFNTAKGTLDEFGEKLTDASGWIGDHKEVVLGLATAYGTLAGLQAAGGAAAAISAVGVAAKTADPRIAALVVGAGLLAAAYAKFEGVRNVVNAFFETWKVGADEHVKKTEQIINAIGGLPDAVNKWVREAGEALLIGSVQLYQGAMKIGKDIVAGVIAGFWAGPQSLASAAWQLGADAIAALRNAVDAHSPSREALEIGQDVVDGLIEGLGAAGPEAFGPIEKELAAFFERQEDETNRHLRRRNELELDFSRSRGEEQKNVLHRIEEEDRNHKQRLEDMEEDHADNMVQAQRQQARDRLSAIQDFVRSFDDLSRDVEAKAAEIGRKAGEALDQARTAARDAKDEIERSTTSNIGGLFERVIDSRGLRGRRDEFSVEEDIRDRTFRAQREDAETAYRWERDKERAQLKFKTDIAKAKTAEEREQIGERLTAETQAADAAYEDAKRERGRRFDLDVQEREFRKSQEAARRAFEDLLEGEALQKQRTRLLAERDARIASMDEALAAKEKALSESETRERATMAKSYTDKTEDLKNLFFGKVGPLVLDEFGKISVFLDGITSKAVAAAAAITGAAGAVSGGSGEQGRNADEQWWADENFRRNAARAGMDPALSVQGTERQRGGVQMFPGGGVVQGPGNAHLLVGVRPGEGVFTPEQMAALGRGGSGQPINIVLQLEVDGLAFARATGRYLPNQLDRVLRLEVG